MRDSLIKHYLEVKTQTGKQAEKLFNDAYKIFKDSETIEKQEINYILRSLGDLSITARIIQTEYKDGSYWDDYKSFNKFICNTLKI